MLFFLPIDQDGGFGNLGMIDNTMIVDPLTHEISDGPTLPRNISNCEVISFKSPAHGGRPVIAMLSYGEDAENRKGATGFFDILDYTMNTTTWETKAHVPEKSHGEEFIGIYTMV